LHFSGDNETGIHALKQEFLVETLSTEPVFDKSAKPIAANRGRA
jgi:hypothetical protein